MNIKNYIIAGVLATTLGAGGAWLLNKPRIPAKSGSLEQTIQGVSRYTPCGNVPCYIPNPYYLSNGYIIACDKYDHCANNNSDSTHEEEISSNALAGGVLGLAKQNPSYIDDGTIILISSSQKSQHFSA